MLASWKDFLCILLLVKSLQLEIDGFRPIVSIFHSNVRLNGGVTSLGDARAKIYKVRSLIDTQGSSKEEKVKLLLEVDEYLALREQQLATSLLQQQPKLKIDELVNSAQSSLDNSLKEELSSLRKQISSLKKVRKDDRLRITQARIS